MHPIQSIKPSISNLQPEKRSGWLRRLILMGSDITALILSISLGWLVSSIVRGEIAPELADPQLNIFTQTQAVIFGLMFAIAIGFSWIWGHYTRFKPFWSELKEVLKIISLIMVIDAIYLFAVKSHFSRVWFFSIITLIALFLPLFRVFAKRMMVFMGIWYRPTVIIGCGDNARNTARAIESDWTMGHKVNAFLKPNEITFPSESISGHPVIPIGLDPKETYLSLDSPYVIFAMDTFPKNEKEKHFLDKWLVLCADMIIAPPLGGLPIYDAEPISILKHEALLLRLKNNLSRRWPKLIKRLFDIMVAALLLSLLAPLFAFLFWRIRRDGGKAMYAHKRVGYKGEHFDCLKFRSMVVDADKMLAKYLEANQNARDEWNRDFKLKNDPRITKIGAVLRETSIDELPQLWNVLKGEMSLVGPRPIVESEKSRYGNFLSYYTNSRPGMTGLWQVSGRNDVDYKHRVDLDVWYGRNWSLWHDIVILLKTIPVVFFQKGGY